MVVVTRLVALYVYNASLIFCCGLHGRPISPLRPVVVSVLVWILGIVVVAMVSAGRRVVVVAVELRVVVVILHGCGVVATGSRAHEGNPLLDHVGHEAFVLADGPDYDRYES